MHLILPIIHACKKVYGNAVGQSASGVGVSHPGRLADAGHGAAVCRHMDVPAVLHVSISLVAIGFYALALQCLWHRNACAAPSGCSTMLALGDPSLSNSPTCSADSDCWR